MSLIGIILFVAFVSLLVKALFETARFLCVAVYCGLMYLVALLLEATAAVMRLCGMGTKKKTLVRSQARSKTQPAFAGAISFR